MRLDREVVSNSNTSVALIIAPILFENRFSYNDFQEKYKFTFYNKNYLL